MSEKTFTPIVTSESERAANPVWATAHILSEWYNDNAPIGWERYILPAQQIVDMLEKRNVG